MDSTLMVFAVGLLVSFLGTLPFGPINLSVVKFTVDYNRLRGLEIALAASLVEMLQVSVAVWFGMLISDFLAGNFLFRLLLAAVFIGLAVYFFLGRDRQATISDKSDAENSFFKRGLIIAALNPQAVPFWIFALAAIDQNFNFNFVGSTLLLFLSAVFLGKLLALYGFVLISDYLKSHLSQSSRLVNCLLAAVLFTIGMGQVWQLISS